MQLTVDNEQLIINSWNWWGCVSIIGTGELICQCLFFVRLFIGGCGKHRLYITISVSNCWIVNFAAATGVLRCKYFTRRDHTYNPYSYPMRRLRFHRKFFVLPFIMSSFIRTRLWFRCIGRIGNFINPAQAT